MANTMTELIPKIIGYGGRTLRQKAILPRYINTDFSAMAGQQGEEIKLYYSDAKTPYGITPGMTTSAPTNSTPTSKTIPLDQWRAADFHLTADEIAKIVKDPNYVSSQISECYSALADELNTYLWGKVYKGVGNYSGTAGTTPFASDATALTAAGLVLDTTYAPEDGRWCLLNPLAKSKALNLATFQYATNAGDTEVQHKGRLGQRLGFDVDWTQSVPLHTAGTITTGLIAKAATAQAVGVTSITATTAASTGACALVAGDVIAIAGHTQTYAVTAAATQATAATDVTISISPPLKVALAGSEAITVKGTHRVNLTGTRDLAGLAMRTLDADAANMLQLAGTQTETVTDPMTGIPYRLDIIPGDFMVKFRVSILYGGAILRPDCGCRIAGEAT